VKMKNNQKKIQQNNAGFSLLEVLVAIIILAVVSIPLLYGFVTSAKTNGEAKILMRATESAENMMEIFELQTMEELGIRYSASSMNTVSVDADGKYEFTIKNTGDFPIAMPDGYYMTVSADPTMYPNANSLNLSDMQTVSATDSAVYSMSTKLDESVYEKYSLLNDEAHETSPGSYGDMDEDYFKKNLIRIIEVDVTKKGEDVDAEGNAVDLVTVDVRVTYDLKNYAGVLPVDQKRYEALERELFNNITTKEPLNSVFVLYQPRYLAAMMVRGDKVVVNNPDNIEANLFVVAQRGAADEGYLSQYLSTTSGLELTIAENPSASGFPSDTEAAMTLFTNLNSGAPYSSSDPNYGEMKCALTYQNTTGSLKANNEIAKTILHAKDLDGKALDNSQTKTRIYKLITTVYNGNGDKVVELDGTKLE